MKHKCWPLILAFIFSFTNPKTQAQGVQVTDLGFENFKEFYLNTTHVMDLLTVDSLASVYSSWDQKLVLNNRSQSELNGSRSFDMFTNGLEVNYTEPDEEAGSGDYQFRNLVITNS